jgi:hypothetical protein
MVDDFSILGIGATDDMAAIKAAYRRRVKEVHPDNSGGEVLLRNHLLFISINQAYGRLKARLGQDPAARGGGKVAGGQLQPRAKAATAAGAAAGGRQAGLPASHADPAWAFYRNAMKFFMQVHPSRWNSARSPFEANKLPMDDAEREEKQRIVSELAGLFPKAYWYFSIVVNEYPESPWCADSREKMARIEELSGKYRKILESFKAWPEVAKDGARRVAGIVRDTEERLEGEARPLKWPD